MDLKFSVGQVFFDVPIPYSHFEEWKNFASHLHGINSNSFDTGYISPADAMHLRAQLTQFYLKMEDGYYKWLTLRMILLLYASVESGYPLVFESR